MKISNRDLLRNYRVIKNKLVSGEVHEIIVPQSSGAQLKITLQRSRKKHTIDRLLEKIEKNPNLFKGLKRPEEDII